MLCKYCNKEIENDSIFCRFCGEKVVRARRKPKDEISVPPPAVTPSGKYRGRVMVNGRRVWITEGTEAAYYIRARAIKAGLIEQQKIAPKATLHDLIGRFISDNEGVLSPSTVSGYLSIQRTKFLAYMNKDISSINYQQMISRETDLHSSKTVKNAWRLVTAALRYAKLPVPTVRLPKSARTERAFLDFDELTVFVHAIRGDACEVPFLLALHSLRHSEIMALTSNSFQGDVIHVRGARIRSKNGYVVRDLNKTDLSRRDVPIMIDRLKELLSSTAFPLLTSNQTLNLHLRQICEKSDLPNCTLHCLRHSFASLAYHLHWTEKSTMLLGGWATPDIVHDIYTHLSEKDVNDDIVRMQSFYNATPQE